MERLGRAGEGWHRSLRAALVGLALAGAAALVAGGAQARPDGGGCAGKRHGFGVERLERKVSRLELAPETEKAVYAALDEARAARRSLDRDVHAAHEKMRALLEQDRPAVADVLAQADVLGELESRLRKADLKAMVAVRSLLSPQQWQALHEHRHERERRAEVGEGL